MKRLEAKIIGHVQGVFFRANTKREADRLGLVGKVRNEPDGSVYVLAEGSEDDLEEFLKFLKLGPDHAKVEKVETIWGKATGEFGEFRIEY